MQKYDGFLKYTGDLIADRTFILEYQKSILFILQEEGHIDQVQLEECVRRLKLQYNNIKSK